MSRFRRVLLALSLLLVVVACSRPADTAPTQAAGLQGGVLATFDVDGETFKAWVTNPQTIDQLLALQAGESAANIPNGRLLDGPGQANHNAPWTWHLDPQDIEMAEVTVEVCDGRPSYVEENKAEFIETIGRYCPWGAKLVTLEDRR